MPGLNILISSHFSAYGKTMHNQTKYIILDGFYQEAKNLDVQLT